MNPEKLRELYALLVEWGLTEADAKALLVQNVFGLTEEKSKALFGASLK